MQRPLVTRAMRAFLAIAALLCAIPAAATAAPLQSVRLENQVFQTNFRIEPGSHDVTLVNCRFENGITIDENVQRVHIEGSYINASRSNGLIFSADASDPVVEDVRIVGNLFEDIGVHAVNLRNFRRVSVERNEFKGTHSWDGVVHTGAIRTFAGGEDLTIDGNFLHDNDSQGIFLKDGRVDRVRIFNNLLVGNGKREPMLMGNLYDAHDVLIANNTIMRNGGGVTIRTTSRGVDIRNNLFDTLTVEDADALAYEDYNFLGTRKGDLTQWTALRTGTHNIQGGLQFVDPDTYDFRLARGSTGVDAGTSERAPDFDRLGVPRTDSLTVLNTGSGAQRFYDIGAHEVPEEPPPAVASSPVISTGNPLPAEETRSPLAIAIRARSPQRLRRGRGLRMRLACSLGCRLDVWLRVRIGQRIVTSSHEILGLPPGRFGRATPRFSPRLARAVRARLRAHSYIRMTVAIQAQDQFGRSTFTSKRVQIVGRRRS